MGRVAVAATCTVSPDARTSSSATLEHAVACVAAGDIAGWASLAVALPAVCRRDRRAAAGRDAAAAESLADLSAELAAGSRLPAFVMVPAGVAVDRW